MATGKSGFANRLPWMGWFSLLLLGFAACDPEPMSSEERHRRKQQEKSWQHFQEHRSESRNMPKGTAEIVGDSAPAYEPPPFELSTQLDSMREKSWEDLGRSQAIVASIIFAFIGGLFLWLMGFFAEEPPGLFKSLAIALATQVLVYSGLPVLPFVLLLILLVFWGKFRFGSGLLIAIIYGAIQLILRTVFLPFVGRILDLMAPLMDRPL